MKSKILIYMLLLPFFMMGQDVNVLRAVSNSTYPELYWYSTAYLTPQDFSVYRADVKTNTFAEIKTLRYSQLTPKTDTLIFVVIDTTLTTQGIFVYYIGLAQDDKVINSERAIGHNFGLLPVPQVVGFNAEADQQRKAITLRWQLNHAETLTRLSLYRSKTYDDNYEKVSDLPVEATEFTDNVPLANEPWFYVLYTEDYFGNTSASTRIPAFATFAEIPMRPQSLETRILADTVVLRWRNVGNNIIGCRIYRSLDNGPYRVITDNQHNTTGSGSFQDFSAEVASSVYARYYIRNVSDGFAESASSDTVELYFANHEPLLPPLSPDYFVEDNGDVKLIWLPDKRSLQIGFNIFLVAEDGVRSKLNSAVITQNHFVDSSYRTAGNYTYYIQSVGLEDRVSAMSAPTTIYRSAPKIEVALNIERKKNGFEISWDALQNNHIKKVVLYRQAGTNKPQELASFNVEEPAVFLDKKLVKGETYHYTLVAIMENKDKEPAGMGVTMDW